MRQMIWKRSNGKIESDSITKWSYIVFLAGLSSIFIDFLFFYVPSVRMPNSIYMDWKLGAYIAILRSIADLISFLGIIMIFHTQNIHAFEKQEINMEPKDSKLSFILNLISILPIPQVVVVLKVSTVENICLCVAAQFPFRALALSPSYKRAIKTMGMHMKNQWLGALQNLSFFILSSHGLGALQYSCYIYKLYLCRSTLYEDESDAGTLEWDELLSKCVQKYEFEFGLFSDYFTTKIGTRSFIQRYTYSLAWGLKSLSSFGQIFSASSYDADTFLSFVITVYGLVLFGDLLARMQTGLQCSEQKEDKQRARQRMMDEWMKYHQLPQPLKKQVKQAIQSQWSTTRDIDDEAILASLPWDIKSEIRRNLYLDTIRTMPLFKEMDDDLINAMCGYLRTFSRNKGTYVAFQGEPVNEMLFVFSGELEVLAANTSGKCATLGPGDLCGTELLQWCSHPTTSTENLKPATQTIKCITDIDAFALRVDDVKLLAIQFYRDGKFRRAFESCAA